MKFCEGVGLGQGPPTHSDFATSPTSKFPVEALYMADRAVARMWKTRRQCRGSEGQSPSAGSRGSPGGGSGGVEAWEVRPQLKSFHIYLTETLALW